MYLVSYCKQLDDNNEGVKLGKETKQQWEQQRHKNNKKKKKKKRTEKEEEEEMLVGGFTDTSARKRIVCPRELKTT